MTATEDQIAKAEAEIAAKMTAARNADIRRENRRTRAIERQASALYAIASALEIRNQIEVVNMGIDTTKHHWKTETLKSMFVAVKGRAGL